MVDPSWNPGYVDPVALQRLAEFNIKLKQRMLELLRIASGNRVLDVGCGPGNDTVKMAQRVGRQGVVVGIDYDKSMINQANQLAHAAGVTAWTTHVLGDAAALPFRGDTFDICHSERLLQHVGNGSKVLEEMVRVTRTGGRLAVADTDWCTLSIDTQEIAIERRITQGLVDVVHNGYAGRQLFRLFKERHLADVQVELHPVIWTDWNTFRTTSFSILDLEKKLIESGAVTNEDLQRFTTSLEEAQRRGVFFASGSVILATGVKAA